MTQPKRRVVSVGGVKNADGKDPALLSPGERLIIESGPDPVELLREVAAVLNGQEYVMPQVCERITDYLAAIEEE